MNISPIKPIIGYPFAAPLSGKDTAERGLKEHRPDINVIHMSTLLSVVIERNHHYQKVVEEGGLLPPEEAVKAFRRGFLEVTSHVETERLPHIFANGACREEYETKQNMRLVNRVRKHAYQQVGFRFWLDKEHILSRAAERVKQALARGEKPRPDDLGETPIVRYEIFHKNLAPVLLAFEAKGGVIIDIDANQTPPEVLKQIMSVYDTVKIGTLTE